MKKPAPPAPPPQFALESQQAYVPIKFDLADYRDYLQRKPALPPPPLEPLMPFHCAGNDAGAATDTDSEIEVDHLLHPHHLVHPDFGSIPFPTRSVSETARTVSRGRSQSLDATTMRWLACKPTTHKARAATTTPFSHSAAREPVPIDARAVEQHQSAGGTVTKRPSISRSYSTFSFAHQPSNERLHDDITTWRRQQPTALQSATEAEAEAEADEVHHQQVVGNLYHQPCRVEEHNHNGGGGGGDDDCDFAPLEIVQEDEHVEYQQ
jgi:hypothetical protein